MARWINEKLIAANKAGEKRRGEDDSSRPPGVVVDACCGLLRPTVVFFAITPWVWINIGLLIGFVFYFLAMMPLATFLQSLYLLRFGYARLDDDEDGGGSKEDPSPDLPPFGGLWKQGPRRGRGRRSAIKTRRRGRGCGRQKNKERPLVSPGPR